MATRKPKLPAKKSGRELQLLPDPEWHRTLFRLWDKAVKGGLVSRIPEADKVRPATRSRARALFDDHPDGTRTPNPDSEGSSVDTLEEIRQEVIFLLGDEAAKELPPPFVAVHDQDEFRWITAGNALRAVSPKLYEEIIRRSEAVATTRRANVDAQDEARRAERDLVELLKLFEDRSTDPTGRQGR